MKKLIIALSACTILVFTAIELQARLMPVTGTVTDAATQMTIADVVIKVKNSTVQTTTNQFGEFILMTDQTLPITVTVSRAGYYSTEFVLLTYSFNDIELLPDYSDIP